MGERLRVPLGEVQEFRIGSEVEGLLGEAVPGRVHVQVSDAASVAPAPPTAPSPKAAGAFVPGTRAGRDGVSFPRWKRCRSAPAASRSRLRSTARVPP